MSYCIPAERNAGRPQDQATAICGQYWRDRDKSMKEPVFKSGLITKAKDRSVRFVASDETPDHIGDVMRTKGWKLDQFRRNPVLLWSHEKMKPPIGMVDWIGVIGNQLIADATFVDKSVYPFADSIYQMVKQGVVNAVSVGFIPHEGKPSGVKGGIEYTSQTLSELSVVSVPMNPNALAIAKGCGLSSSDIKRLFEVDSDHQRMARNRLDVIKLRVRDAN